MTRIDTDVVVVGTGPGGATVALELAKQGRRVVMVERGRWHELLLGHYVSFGTVTRVFFSKERGLMGKGITVGGSSVVYNGNAYDPPDWLGTELGIELSEEAAETRAELGIGTLPDEFYDGWPHTRRLMDAAAELDIALMPQEKFIDPNRCDPTCDDCMLGCRRGAKWTAREYVVQAQRRGARLLDRSSVSSVIRDNGRVTGVKLKGPHGIEEVRADKVVLAAGGVGTPLILLASGFKGAGEGFFIDPMNVVFAVGKHRGPIGEPTFSVASEEFVESDGYLVGNLGWTVLMKGLPRIPRWRGKYKNSMGMFTKIGDSAGGRIHADGKIEKPYNADDEEKFRKGTEACKNIMVKAGADPDSFKVAHNIGGHPGGTAAIGRVVGDDLQSLDAKGLYVCDASVFPRSPGRPPTLTLVSMGKWLAKRI